MSTTGLNAEDLLSSLETFLQTLPGQEIAPLHELPAQLNLLSEATKDQTAEEAFQILGTAVGKNQKWQTPFREAGLLTHAIEALDSYHVTTKLAKQYLRVLGNSVADNDKNREFVLERLSSLQALFLYIEEEECTLTVLGVLLNLCNDYDPAQIRAAKLRIDIDLSRFLVGKESSEGATELATELITWTTDKLTQAQLEEEASIEVFQNVLKLALQYDEDRYPDFVSILVHYLQSSEFQQKVAKPETFNDLVDLMFGFEDRLEPDEPAQVYRILATRIDASQDSSNEINILLTAQLINSLSAMSSTDAFIRHFTLSDPTISKLLGLFDFSITAKPSAVFACVALGNLATSDPVSEALVHTHKIHERIFQRIFVSKEKETAFLYAAAALLRHLAFPEKNRSELASAGRIDQFCYLLYEQQDPSVRGEVAATLGKLVSNNWGNIELLVKREVPQNLRLSFQCGHKQVQEAHLIDYIVAQALVPTKPVPSTSMKTAAIELGRTIVNILRTLGQADANNATVEITQKIFRVPSVIKPVARLVQQRFFAEPRSEGLLGLGLMAQSREGASCVWEELRAESGLLDSIKELAVGQGGAGQDAAQGIERDRQNALVLLHALLKNGANEAAVGLKENIEDLIKELGAGIA